MGNQYLDIGWALLIAAAVFIPWLAYRLGIEVGRDQVRREIRSAKRRVEAARNEAQHRNFRVINGGAGQTPRQAVGVNNNNKEG